MRVEWFAGGGYGEKVVLFISGPASISSVRGARVVTWPVRRRRFGCCAHDASSAGMNPKEKKTRRIRSFSLFPSPTVSPLPPTISAFAKLVTFPRYSDEIPRNAIDRFCSRTRVFSKGNYATHFAGALYPRLYKRVIDEASTWVEWETAWLNGFPGERTGSNDSERSNWFGKTYTSPTDCRHDGYALARRASPPSAGTGTTNLTDTIARDRDTNDPISSFWFSHHTRVIIKPVAISHCAVRDGLPLRVRLCEISQPSRRLFF